jgi:hypothetical protein
MSEVKEAIEFDFNVSFVGDQSNHLTRRSRYQFCLNGGCVFADFDEISNDDGITQLQLVRISFDGFGCCRCSHSNLLLSHEESGLLIKLIPDLDHNDVRQNEASQLLGSFFNRIKDEIWEDALIANDILPQGEPDLQT